MRIWTAYAFLSMGVFFSFFGALGVIRFPDVYLRLHAAAKCTTTGVLSIFVGLMILEGLNIFSARMLALALFTFLTSPLTSHAIGRSAYEFGIFPWRKRRGR